MHRRRRACHVSALAASVRAKVTRVGAGAFGAPRRGDALRADAQACADAVRAGGQGGGARDQVHCACRLPRASRDAGCEFRVRAGHTQRTTAREAGTGAGWSCSSVLCARCGAFGFGPRAECCTRVVVVRVRMCRVQCVRGHLAPDAGAGRREQACAVRCGEACRASDPFAPSPTCTHVCSECVSEAGQARPTTLSNYATALQL